MPVVSMLRPHAVIDLEKDDQLPSTVVPMSTPTRLIHPEQITDLVDIRSSIESLTPQQRWHHASSSQRHTAQLRMRLLKAVIELTDKGVKDRAAILNTISRIEARELPRDMLDIAQQLSQKNAVCPGKATFYNWLKLYRDQGLPGLLPQHTGRVRQAAGWEIAALRLYHIPSKPGFADVAIALDRLGLSATAKQVERFIKSLPAEYGCDSPWRVGKHYYQQNLGRYKAMDHSTLEVGQLYQGDGHTCDAYVEHPHSGYLYRAELTIWIDVRSHYVVGWHLSAAESGESTLYALSNALTTQDHVPDSVHIDNGSGFVNQMMSEAGTGFYNRFGITPKKAIPGNSKGKGLVEGWFRHFRNRHDKFWNGGLDYCGHDMADEVNRQINQKIKSGERKLLPYSLYKESVAAYIHEFNHRVQKSLGGKSPAELWQTLNRNTVELPDAAVVRPQYKRKVRRLSVNIFNRIYEHQLLSSYHKHEVIVEVDLNDDTRVWIYNDQQRLICTAELKTKRAWALDSISDDRQQRREKGRLDRLRKKAELVKAEESQLYDHSDTLAVLESVQEQPELPNSADDDIEIDLTLEFSNDSNDDDIQLEGL